MICLNKELSSLTLFATFIIHPCPAVSSRFKFKALELNRKILEGALNPKKPTVKESTRPEGFHLHMDKRLTDRNASKKPEEPEEQHTFHSRPLPVRILEEVVVSATRPTLVFTTLSWIGSICSLDASLFALCSLWYCHAEQEMSYFACKTF